MSNLARRILTALTLGSLVVFLIWYSVYGFLFCMAVVSVGSLIEFYGITELRKNPISWLLVTSAVVVWAWETLFLTGQLQSGPSALEFGFLLPLIVILLLYNRKEKDPIRSSAILFFGPFYTVLPFFLFFEMAAFPVTSVEYPSDWGLQIDYHFEIAIGTLFLVWCVDTVAYFGGRFLGKNKLMERISPKKTWEGAITGTLGCFGLAWVLNLIWPDVWVNWFYVALVMAPVSQLGDLVESMFKRSLKIKDSGGLLPGHGGLLDRFDGFFIGLPVLWLFLQVLSLFSS